MGRRRHGIEFLVSPPALPDSLPRMDVAGFVGFAAAGPVNIPVLVEDVVRFRSVFGPDLELARDGESGEVVRGYLGPAVSAFFANGGHRCWVVRVASAGAAPNRFAVPGLAWVGQDGVIRPARAAARSSGSWSDRLRVGTVLRRVSLGTATKVSTPADGQAEIKLDSALAPEPLRPGDLLRLAQGTTLCFVAVDRVTGPAEDSLRRVAGRAWWFATDRRDGAVQVDGLGPAGVQTASAALEDNLLLFVGEADPLPGALLTLRAGGTKGYAMVTAVRRQVVAEGSSATGVAAEISAPLWRLSPTPAEGVMTTPALERLTFDLTAMLGETVSRLTGLGFTAAHSRSFGALPADELLFGGRAEAIADALSPRFPLAADEPGAAALPLGMAILWQPEATAAAINSGAPALERDGLATLSPDLFVDPDLARYGTATLGEAILFRQDEAERTGSTAPALTGIHTLWPLDEVTLLSAPDCLHRQWVRTELPAVDELPPPVLHGRKRLSWDAPDPAEVPWLAADAEIQYRLQESSDPQFRQLTATWVMTGRLFRATAADCCPEARYYRVRSEVDGQISPWSNTRLSVLPELLFRPVAPPPPAPPRLEEPEVEGDLCRLRWSRVDRSQYVLESATSPDFADPQVIYEGDQTGASLLWGPVGVRYFRVRAGEAPWSNTVRLRRQRDADGWLIPAGTRPALALPVQKAMLCMSEARGDLVSVLSLPWLGSRTAADARVRARDEAAYLRDLAGGVGVDVERQLSYGVLYHPWLRQDGGLVPPEGAAAGRIADRALRRGAWVAPANEVLSGVTSLATLVTGAEAEVLAASQANLVERTPKGLSLLSAETLSGDPDLSALNVRRLLILLRRLALREGQSLLFQPNSEQFRHLVQMRFETLLTDLYARGALAGSRPEEAFQVVTDSSVNPPEATDQGLFVVELRVAPSRPLAFLQVRLVQSAAGPTVTEV